jgi:hypothetical protein
VCFSLPLIEARLYELWYVVQILDRGLDLDEALQKFLDIQRRKRMRRR